MHIVRVCPAYYPHYFLGGSVVADFELDRALVAEGHRVTVLTCRYDEQEDSELKVCSRHRILRSVALGKIKYGISFCPLLNLVRYCSKRFKGEDESADVVWFGGVWNLLSVLGPVICRMFSTKYIVTPHGMLIPSLIGMRSSKLKSLVIQLFLRSHLEKAHRVHFTVESEFEETKQATQAKMMPVVFPLFFDLSKFSGLHERSPRSATDKLTLSFVGRLTQKKRIDLVFDALASLGPETKDKVRFNVIGVDESIWKEEEYNTDKVGVEINYRGPLYGEDLVRSYSECDVFILCSESENFGISVVEAAYCYCVPLISEQVGVGAYFSKKSAVFSELSASAICEHIEALVRDPAALLVMAREARNVSEQFDVNRLDSHYFSKLLECDA